MIEVWKLNVIFYFTLLPLLLCFCHSNLYFAMSLIIFFFFFFLKLLPSTFLLKYLKTFISLLPISLWIISTLRTTDMKCTGVHIFHHHLQLQGKFGDWRERLSCFCEGCWREFSHFTGRKEMTKKEKQQRRTKVPFVFLYISSKDSFLIKQISYLIKIMIQKMRICTQNGREDLKKIQLLSSRS